MTEQENNKTDIESRVKALRAKAVRQKSLLEKAIKALEMANERLKKYRQ